MYALVISSSFNLLQMVQAFTGAPAILEVEKGGRISLMNGHVTGGFIELVRQNEA